ncbi:DNA-binding protein [Burkholderia vietnamiensis]|nr:DNA-binding protein [Burkholderia vietnamiensis]
MNLDAANSFIDDTEQFAELNGVKAQSVRKRYAQTGSYFGVRPLKLANRRLKWPHIFATQREAVAAAHALLDKPEVA